MSVTFENFWFRYPNSSWVLKNINLHIDPGEIVIIAGPTGSGKSTMLFALSGLIPEYINGFWKGDVKINHMSTIKNFKRLAGVVGIVFQNFEDQLFSLTVEEEISLGPLNADLPLDEVKNRVTELLRFFDLAELRHRPISSLSYGQKQRVVIASMMALDPEVFLLDEPFSQLDEESSRKLNWLIGKLKKSGRTILISEHEIIPLLDIADRLLLIRDGKILYNGEPYIDQEKLIELGLRIRYPHHKKRDSTYKNYVLVTSDVSCGWYKKAILRWVNIFVREQETVGITGPNGSGKTTLGLTLIGVLSPISGEIFKKGRTVMVFQNPDNNLIFDNVWDEVFFPLKQAAKDLSVNEVERITEELLDAAYLTKYKEKDPHGISKGERLRLAVISSISSMPSTLILDEPTMGQDYKSLSWMMEIIEEFSRKFKFGTVILTHNRRYARAICDRVYNINRKGILTLDYDADYDK